MNCVICDGTVSVVYSALSDRLHPDIPGTYTLVQCDFCALLFIDPLPSDKDLSAHYPDTYHVYQRLNPEIPPRKLSYIKKVACNFFGYGNANIISRLFLIPFYYKVSQLPYWKEGGKLLDIGCSVGDRMQVFKALGWCVAGIEMSPRAVQVARKAGYNVKNASLIEADLPESKYDVVHLNNVFEHFKDPRKALDKIRHTLKDDGELLLVVPNLSSFASRFFKKDWFALEVPRHIFTYNKKNLSQLLRQYGFSVTQVSYQHTLGSMTSSTAYKTGKHVDTYAFLEKFFWGLEFILDPIFNVFGVGDWMVVRARLNKSNDK